MATNVQNTRGTTTYNIPNKGTNTETDLTLVGKGYRNYTQPFAENFVKLLENFANSTMPSRPVEGQLWYKSDDDVISYYDNTRWKAIGSLTVTTSIDEADTNIVTGAAPNDSLVGGKAGHLWLNSNGRLRILVGTSWVDVGGGIDGTQIVARKRRDNTTTTGVSHDVLELLVNNQIVAVISSDNTTWIPHQDEEAPGDTSTNSYRNLFPGNDINKGVNYTNDFFIIRGRPATFYNSDGSQGLTTENLPEITSRTPTNRYFTEARVQTALNTIDLDTLNGVGDLSAAGTSTGRGLVFDNGNLIIGNPGITVRDSDTTLNNVNNINFTGAGVSATGTGSNITVDIPGAAVTSAQLYSNDKVLNLLDPTITSPHLRAGDNVTIVRTFGTPGDDSTKIFTINASSGGGLTFDIQSITRQDNSEVRIRFDSNHAFDTGDQIVINGVTGTNASLFNGLVFTVTRVDADEIDIPVTNSGSVSATGGSASRTYSTLTALQANNDEHDVGGLITGEVLDAAISQRRIFEHLNNILGSGTGISLTPGSNTIRIDNTASISANDPIRLNDWIATLNGQPNPNPIELTFGNSRDARLYYRGSENVFDIELESLASAVRITDNGTVRFTFEKDGDFIAARDVTSYSDLRLKENVKTITDALDTVSQLRGVSYRRTDTEKNQIGLVAQEVKEVVPSVVNESGEYLSLAYGNLSALFVEALKEAKSTIQSLESRIAQLEKG